MVSDLRCFLASGRGTRPSIIEHDRACCGDGSSGGVLGREGGESAREPEQGGRDPEQEQTRERLQGGGGHLRLWPRLRL